MFINIKENRQRKSVKKLWPWKSIEQAIHRRCVGNEPLGWNPFNIFFTRTREMSCKDVLTMQALQKKQLLF